MSTNCNDEAIDADHLTKLTRFAVQEAAEAMFTIASDGRFLDVNEIACERLEYERHELLNMYVGDIDPLYPREQWPVLWERLRTLGKIILQGRHRTKSGREFEVEISASYFGFDGQEYCCSFARDTTLQRQSEQIATIQQKVLAEAATDSSNLSETLNLLCEMVEELIPESLASIMLLDLNDDCLRFEAGPKLSPVVRAAFEPLKNWGMCRFLWICGLLQTTRDCRRYPTQQVLEVVPTYRRAIQPAGLLVLSDFRRARTSTGHIRDLSSTDSQAERFSPPDLRNILTLGKFSHSTPTIRRGTSLGS